MNTTLLFVGLVPVTINATTGAYAAYRRRALPAPGFTLAAFNGIVITLIVAGANVPFALIVAYSLLRSPVSLMICWGFWANHLGRPRPGHWKP